MLAARLAVGADAGAVADACVLIWQEIDVALMPILGERGVVMLYKRSLYLTGSGYPWLAGMHEGVLGALDLGALKAVLAAQSSEAARHSAVALLRTFHGLLASLVGPALTARLLHSVLPPSTSGASAQDPSP